MSIRQVNGHSVIVIGGEDDIALSYFDLQYRVINNDNIASIVVALYELPDKHTGKVGEKIKRLTLDNLVKTYPNILIEFVKPEGLDFFIKILTEANEKLKQMQSKEVNDEQSEAV